MSPALGYHRFPAPRAGGILGGLDACDLTDLRELYEVAAKLRHGHPRDFTRAVRDLQRLCRALRIDSLPFERCVMLAIFHFAEAAERIDRSPVRVSA